MTPGLRPGEGSDPVAAKPSLSAGTPTVLRVDGIAELTSHTGNPCRNEVSAALNGHDAIDINLSHTTFIDCSGLGALIALGNTMRDRRGSLRLLNASPAVRRLLAILHAEPLFDLVNTVG
jgi:anti-anti-sigma factor